MAYNGRPARLLFGGDGSAAMSGIAQDDNPELLFDYNQRFMEFIMASQPRNLLLIGGGVFTLPMAIRRQVSQMRIDAVEPDEKLIEVAKQFFGLYVSRRLHIIVGDGYSYLAVNRKRYDCIIVDAFDAIAVPESIISPDAITQMYCNLQPNGFVAMNVIAPGRSSAILRRYKTAYEKRFRYVAIFQADINEPLEKSQNFVIVARSITA